MNISHIPHVSKVDEMMAHARKGEQRPKVSRITDEFAKYEKTVLMFSRRFERAMTCLWAAASSAENTSGPSCSQLSGHMIPAHDITLREVG
jgi:hypothetical protein